MYSDPYRNVGIHPRIWNLVGNAMADSPGI